MKDRTRVLWRWWLAACMAAVAVPALASTPDTPGTCLRQQGAVTVTDMAGRVVTLPGTAKRVATVGSVPVINGYLFALEAGDRIVNGLPWRFSASGRWQLHQRVAPHLAGLPVLQGQAGADVNLEALMQLLPDVVVTMDRTRIRPLEASRIPVVYLAWGSESDIRQNMQILGCILDREQQANDYLTYFDAVMSRLRQALDAAALPVRPKVLYFNPHTMTTPLQIANWWIAQAGGDSVTEGLGNGGNVQYSHERLLQWNPDVLIVGTPEQVTAVYQDARFSRVAAVQNKQVHATPMGTHSWGQRTIEQPLTVLWAASVLFPQRLSGAALRNEIQGFYRRFFRYALSEAEIDTMMSGG